MPPSAARANPSPRLVGIVNITPDSFSDGGQALRPADALRRAAQLIEDGASVLDVGAESTRPGATPLSPQGEWARLSPVLAELAALCRAEGVALSVDTRHGETAHRALEAGADWINDVSGFQDDAMLAAVRDTDCRLVAMHALSVPASRSRVLPPSTDIAALMRDWCKATRERLAQAGIAPDRLILDPGIGFGKTARQSWALLADAPAWLPENVPVLIGHSRKSFLSLFSENEPAPDLRDALTRQLSALLAAHGVAWLRVHDVAGHRLLFAALEA